MELSQPILVINLTKYPVSAFYCWQTSSLNPPESAVLEWTLPHRSWRCLFPLRLVPITAIGQSFLLAQEACQSCFAAFKRTQADTFTQSHVTNGLPTVGFKFVSQWVIGWGCVVYWLEEIFRKMCSKCTGFDYFNVAKLDRNHSVSYVGQKGWKVFPAEKWSFIFKVRKIE